MPMPAGDRSCLFNNAGKHTITNATFLLIFLEYVLKVLIFIVVEEIALYSFVEFLSAKNKFVESISRFRLHKVF